MSDRAAKVFARIRGYRRSPAAADGALEFSLEFTRLDSSASGIFVITPAPITNEKSLADDLRDALADHVGVSSRHVVIAGL